MMPRLLPFLVLFLFPFCALWSTAEEKAVEKISDEQLRYFETHVRPNLIKYCYECHSEKEGQSKGGLLVDTRNGMREGGSSGPLFDEENWRHSFFVDAITHADSDYAMPPKSKMPQAVIDVLLKWVEMGAPDPRVRKDILVKSEINIEAGKSHWAYQPVTAQAGQTIDRLVTQKQRALGVAPVDPAPALQLLRRLCFDLTGLPPSPEEAKAFHSAAKRDRERAVTKLVEHLLASPQYGERWGRHWLDVARYAESAGTTNDTYPYAWRYRDYVIDAFNNDVPYDRFIREQLAGDVLPAKTDADWQRNIIATGFLALGAKKQNEKNPRQFHADLIDEQIDTTTRAFLGLTVACARCHDHKYDAIPTADYYAMAGIFNSSKTYYGTIAGNQNHRVTTLISLPVADQGGDIEANKRRYAAKQAELEELRRRNRDMRSNDNFFDNGGTKRDLVSMRQRIMRAESELKLMNPNGIPATFGMGVLEGTPSDSPILDRGDVTKVAQIVPRGFLQVLDFAGPANIKAGSSGRRELAEWIAHPRNPLTARVYVNRVWMHLMGTPLVDTMDNWGENGLKPSNPELLDHLASQFMREGWSTKTLIRSIVLSDTYQRASTFHQRNYGTDPENKGYWRANPRQLDAEALRDAMVSASGKLDLKRPYASKIHEIGDTKIGRRMAPETVTQYDPPIRSVYLPAVRDAQPESLALFDANDPNRSVGKRDETNVAPQSLHLMNSPMMARRAKDMASRLEDLSPNVDEQVKYGFLLAYTRMPSPGELAASKDFIATFTPGKVPAPPAAAAPQDRRGQGMQGRPGMQRRPGMQGRRGQAAPATLATPPVGPIDSLSAFCQSLMMSAEFRLLN